VGESVSDVLSVLRGRIALVHVKDARRVGESWELLPAGEGEVPLRAMLKALLQEGYAGLVSVEWEKHWHPEIADPEVALPQHIAWLRSTLREIEEDR
jgi:fatty-acyl-CoA synthase